VTNTKKRSLHVCLFSGKIFGLEALYPPLQSTHIEGLD
jgi:hypothetical protein